MTNLEALVNSYQQRASQFAQTDIAGEERKERWLIELSELNKFIRDSLTDAGVPNEAIQTFDVSIQEDSLGQYRATGLVARIGDAEVRFTPIGSMMIGACGRVDVTSSNPIARTVRLVADVSPQDSAWTWSAYPEQGRAGDISFDKEGLAVVLERVLEGR